MVCQLALRFTNVKPKATERMATPHEMRMEGNEAKAKRTWQTEVIQQDLDMLCRERSR